MPRRAICPFGFLHPVLFYLNIYHSSPRLANLHRSRDVQLYLRRNPVPVDTESLKALSRHRGRLGVDQSLYHNLVQSRLTGLFNILFLLLRPFLMWLFSALESSGLSSSKLQRSSLETDITAPQLSNSPQYYDRQLMLVISLRNDLRWGLRTL